MLTRRLVVGSVASLAVVATTLVTLRSQTAPALDTHAEVVLTGQVTSAAEGPMEGVVVTAKREGSTITASVISDAEG